MATVSYTHLVLLAVAAKIVNHFGSALAELLANGGLTVNNPHGIFFEPVLTCVAQLVIVGGEILFQLLVILGRCV